MSTVILDTLGRRLDECTAHLSRLDSYYNGSQPAAFLSPEAAEALGGRLSSLVVNVPRLAVGSLVERLTLTGFRLGGGSEPDRDLWAVWQANGMDAGSEYAHLDALVLGRSFVLVWAGPDGAPLVTVESPREVAVQRDPATRQVVSALKRWNDPPDYAGVPGKSHAITFTADAITSYETDALGAPVSAWRQVDSQPNPLGVIPVAAVVNRGRLLEVDGRSEMADLLSLSDALAKLMADAMVTSEFYSRPRRWATGIEIPTDDDGNPTNPFASEADKIWLSEAVETRFGQFDPAGVGGYAELVGTITGQLAALAGLPPHYVGLFGDQPASADAIRSAEASLVARAYQRQRAFATGWADVARLIIAVRDGTDTRTLPVEPVWASPETRTVAQEADAAVKLVAAGIIPTSEALARLGYTPERIAELQHQHRADVLNRGGLDLNTLLGGGDAGAAA